MSETKRWLIGVLITASIGLGTLYIKLREDSKPKEPQQIVVKVDPGQIQTQAGGISQAAMSVKIGDDATDETKKEAVEKAKKRAMKEAFEAKVKEIRSTRKVDEDVASQVLASNPEDFFASDPVVVSEDIKNGEMHVEFRFHFDESKLEDALAAVKEAVKQLSCDGSLGPDHPQHRVIVLFRDGGGQVAPPSSQPASTAVREVEKFLRDHGVQLVDPQTSREFYDKAKALAGKMTGPNEFLEGIVDAQKMPCFFMFVSVDVTSEPGTGNVHQVSASMNVTCQNAKGDHVGAGASKQGKANFTGGPNPNSFDQHAAKILKDVIPFATKELWDSAGPALTAR